MNPLLIVMGVVLATPLFAQSLARDPQNPRCFVYKGNHVVLITATEHYGAILNRDFSYLPYLDELARHKLNLSRVFTFYRELEDSIHSLGFANTLAPRAGREVLPWKRVGPGRARDGGLRFDLSQWNREYFSRFKDFLQQAARRDIVVEVTLFCNPYRQNILSWLPCFRDNNVNGVGASLTEPDQFYRVHDPTVFDFQKNFVRMIVQELNPFDNLYFEILNEGAAITRESADQMRAWHEALCDVVRETEKDLPKKHLIAVNAHQQVPVSVEEDRRYLDIGDVQYFNDPRVDIINYHYLSRRSPGKKSSVYYPANPREGRIGNIWSFVRSRAYLDKPVSFDENYAGIINGAPDNWDRNRIEAWETILSGGAVFDHLDWSFTPQDSAGAGNAPIGDGRKLDGRTLRAQLGALAALWRESGPEKMLPDYELVVSAPPQSAAFASRRTDGKRYVVYVADRRANAEGFGDALRGEIALRLPKGRYRLRILHSGAVTWTAAGIVTASSRETKVALPKFRRDCGVVLEIE